VKWYGGCWVLWPLCVFEWTSVVIGESACVRDCRWLGLYIVGIVGKSAGGQCGEGRGSMMIVWGECGR
jgi:hypothetical protein